MDEEQGVFEELNLSGLGMWCSTMLNPQRQI